MLTPINTSLPSLTEPGAPPAPAPALQVEQPHDRDDLLLREVRHRVSNGLQIVAALLLRGARLSQTGDPSHELRAAYGRVMAIAALERHLANSSGEDVNLRDYLIQACDHAATAMIGDPAKVALCVFVEPVLVTASFAASLGMIVTELLTNALKHAFPGDSRGTVTVRYEVRGAGWILSVADNGAGVDTGLPVRSSPPGLGVEIVNGLARQLGAKVEIVAAAPGRVTSVSRSRSLDAS